MPKICYVSKRFTATSQALIEQANDIIADYQAQGYKLTLRQLYYQFVARDLIRNSQREYKRMGSIINDARLAGLIDWHAIEDRTRNLQQNDHWRTPQGILQDCVGWYQLDHWKRQPYRPEVWIEKDALVGVIADVCNELDVPYFSCRGYTSQSEMWNAWHRMADGDERQMPVLLHLGDHDPSGIDMSRDITDRLTTFFFGGHNCFALHRLALNMDQVNEYNPPPNPAKTTDSRFESYTRQYGDDSWELDALEPQVIADLVRKAILALRNDGIYEQVLADEEEGKDRLQAICDREGGA